MNGCGTAPGSAGGTEAPWAVEEAWEHQQVLHAEQQAVELLVEQLQLLRTQAGVDLFHQQAEPYRAALVLALEQLQRADAAHRLEEVALLANASQDATLQNTFALAAQAYYDALAAQRSLAASRQVAELAAQNLEAADAKYRAGAAALSDRLQAAWIVAMDPDHYRLRFFPHRDAARFTVGIDAEWSDEKPGGLANYTPSYEGGNDACQPGEVAISEVCLSDVEDELLLSSHFCNFAWLLLASNNAQVSALA